MSDFYHYWFFPEIDLEEVPTVKNNVLNTLWDTGIVQRENDPDLSLGGTEAYGPADKLNQLCSDPSRLPFDLWTRGMEVVTGFGFLGWELNEIDHAVCPACEKRADLEQTNIIGAVDGFHKTGRIPTIVCPNCKAENNPGQWKSEPALTFTYLGFKFWNWPPFRSSDSRDDDLWTTDIPSLMEAAAHSRIAYSRGRL